MERTLLRRIGALVASAALLASLALVTVAATTSAAPPTCRGEVATIVGTDKGEVIIGTDGRDVVVANGGADTVRTLQGADIVCAGAGEDRVHGGAGRDELEGGSGDDTLQGGTGQDRLLGNAGDDLLDGGLHHDTCLEGSGTAKRVNCENLKVLALAFTDLDGVHAFGDNDVLIAKLVDTNGDKVPSAGDTVMMGRYPTNLMPVAGDFADWGVTSHEVTGVNEATGAWVKVASAAGFHDWVAGTAAEWFADWNASNSAWFMDQFEGTANDVVEVKSDSPSDPDAEVDVSLARSGNDAFIDVVINP